MSWQEDFEKMSEEEKKLLLPKFKGRGCWWYTKTQEELEALKPIYGKARSDWWASIPSEEKDEIFDRQSKSLSITMSKRSIEERQEISKKKSRSLLSRTAEEKAETDKRKKETSNSRPEEIKKGIHLTRSLSSKIGWRNMDQGTRDERSLKASKSKEEMWAGKSLEELNDIRKRQGATLKETLAGKTEEEKELRNIRSGESMSKWWASLSPKEKQAQGKAIVEGQARALSNLSSEEKAALGFKPNSHEEYVQWALDRNWPGDWKYTGDRSFLVGRKNPDFLNVNGKKAVIEYFGSHYHNPWYFPGRMSEEELIAYYKDWGFDCVVLHEHLLCEAHVVKEVSKLYSKEL